MSKASCRSDQSLNPWIRASFWLLFGITCLLISIRPPSSSSSHSEADDQRAAIMSVVEESDVLFVVSSVQELQPHLDLRYEYDWILVSPKPLSDNFKTLSSSASGLNIKHYAFGMDNGKLGWLDSHFNLPNGTEACHRSVVAMLATTSLRQLVIGRRYASYLLLEPRSGLLRTLSRNSQTPFSVATSISHSPASTAPLCASGQDTVQPALSLVSVVDCLSRRARYFAHKAQATAARVTHGLEQLLINFEIHKDVTTKTIFHAICPKRLLDHTDTTNGHFRIGNAYLDAPTISQSTGQPRKSVWSRLRKRDFRYVTRPSAAEPTAESEMKARRTLMPVFKQDVRPRVSSNNKVSTMTDQFEFWDFVAMDFGRQESIPSLRSGNTVIDERNFEML